MAEFVGGVGEAIPWRELEEANGGGIGGGSWKRKRWRHWWKDQAQTRLRGESAWVKTIEFSPYVRSETTTLATYTL